MDRKTRMLTAWAFREPDAVPLEMRVGGTGAELPGAAPLIEFQENEACNFHSVPGFDWGFIGLENEASEEVVEDIPGRYRRVLRKYRTSAGEFTALARYNHDDADKADCAWEKHFIETIDDFRRVVAAPREVRPFGLERYNEACAAVGDRGVPATMLLHPLGVLVRHSRMENLYAWLVSEEKLVLEFLEKSAAQVCETLRAARGLPLADPPVFLTFALEMLTPPWLGRDHFMKLVFPFDSRVNEAVHEIGGRHRVHCHGNSGRFLEIFADMGVDSLEPLEPPPFGDNDLADAKRRVGRRMLLSGNIPSQLFALDDFNPRELREMVRRAIGEGAPGGGFTLRTTGGGVGNGKTREQCARSLACAREIIEAWREFGSY